MLLKTLNLEYSIKVGKDLCGILTWSMEKKSSITNQ